MVRTRRRPRHERAARSAPTLVRHAGWRDAGKLRGLLGRLAWWRLGRVGERGDEHVIEAVWQEWLRRLDEGFWDLLSRWREAEPLAEAVFTAAADPNRPAGHRAAIGAFCARHGMVPGDPVRQAAFYALTAQPQQLYALDPDGTLLATAYGAAGQRARWALHEALASDSDLDVVHMVSGGSGRRLETITSLERRYVRDRLAERRDWARLWQVARELPLRDAVEILRPVDPRWRPDAERELFSVLARADADAVAAGEAAFAASGRTIRIEVPGLVQAGALTDDSRRLAVWTIDDPSRLYHGSRWPKAGTISVYDLPLGTPTARYDAPVQEHAGLAYCGDTLMALASSTDDYVNVRAGTWIYRYPEGQDAELVFHDDTYTTGLAARPAGFVTAGYNGMLTFYDQDGTRSTSTAFRGPNWRFYRNQHQYQPVAVDHGSGRIAVVHAGSVTVLDPAGTHVIADLPSDHTEKGVCFYGEQGEQIVVAGTWCIEKLRLSDRDRRARLCSARDPVCVSGHTVRFLAKHGAVRDLDELVPEPATLSREPDGTTANRLFSSAAGTCYALGGDGFAQVVSDHCPDLLGIAGRPQSALTAADLRDVQAADWLVLSRPQVRPFYDLLRRCLEYRFGEAVTAGWPTPKADDTIPFSRNLGIGIGDCHSRRANGTAL